MQIRLYCTFLGAFLAGLCGLLLTPLTSYADGGAPNRVYVAGTTKGIGVIDITQQQVLGSLPALGFAALQGGSVAMLDLPGRQLVTTFHVGGNPHFIITGLNPPIIGTTPQQANLVSWLLPLTSYLVIGGLFIVPLLLWRKRFTTARVTKEQKRG